MQQQMVQEQFKAVGDVSAFGVSIAAIVGWLPHAAALASLVWACMRIYSEYLTIKQQRAAMKKGK